MPKFKRREKIIEAFQWYENGDHSIVRPFNCPDISGKVICERCGFSAPNHGWIDTLEGGHIVCPGDWIITGIKGEHCPCKPDIFEKLYADVAEHRKKKND